MKLYKKEKYKNREEWLANRGLGGSSASAILHKNPWLTALDLYISLTQPKTKEKTKSNESINYGVSAENLIRKIFALDFKNKYKVIAPKGYELYRRKDKPYLTATLDGRLVDLQTNKKGILEIKTHDVRGSTDYHEWKDHLPDNYYIQLLHYLLVMNDYDFVVLVAKLRFFKNKELSSTEFRYYYFDRESRLEEIKYLQHEESQFWEENVCKKKIPKIVIKV